MMAFWQDKAAQFESALHFRNTQGSMAKRSITKSAIIKPKIKYGADFGLALTYYFKNPPVLPLGKNVGFEWTPKDFAGPNGPSESAVRQWLRGDALPDQFFPSIIAKIFDNKFKEFEVEITELKAVFDRCKCIRDGVDIPLPPSTIKARNLNSTVVQSEHIGADAREGVTVIADKLAEHFYGRGSDLKAISHFVDERMAGDNNGLFIITAPAGFGKSALAVHWCRETEKTGNRHIANHLCSISSGSATTKLDNIFANLRRQMADVYGDPMSEPSHKDAVVRMLKIAPPNGKQLVVWLDGIDEADEIVECFLPTALGDRVCVIISARAHERVTPVYIDQWENSPRAQPYRRPRHDLTKLSRNDVEEMVQGMFAAGGLEHPNILQLGQRIFNASDQGYALFARWMVDDAIKASREGKKIDFGGKPESLEGWAKDHLDRLEGLGTSWKNYQPLFAFLTIAHEAVRIDELPALIGQNILFRTIPEQISRWFVLVPDEGKNSAPLLSFAHPKLKEVFGLALGYLRSAATRDLCERYIASASTTNWPIYAWRNLPRHLIEAGYAEHAIERLIDIQFVTSRMHVLGEFDGAGLMAQDFRAWYQIYRKDQKNG